jgi:hypothetical protein
LSVRNSYMFCFTFNANLPYLEPEPYEPNPSGPLHTHGELNVRARVADRMPRAECRDGSMTGAAMMYESRTDRSSRWSHGKVMAWTGDRRTESINRQPVKMNQTATPPRRTGLARRARWSLRFLRFIPPHLLSTWRRETKRNRAQNRPTRKPICAVATTQPVRGGVHAHILFGETSTAQALSRKQKGRSHRATARAAQRVASEAYACRMVAVPRCVSQATEPPWSGPGLASRHCTHPSRFSHA